LHCVLVVKKLADVWKENPPAHNLGCWSPVAATEEASQKCFSSWLCSRQSHRGTHIPQAASHISDGSAASDQV